MQSERIIVVMDGGVIQDIIKPPSLQHIEIEVRDFDEVDVSLYEDDVIKEDSNGNKYVEAIW